MKIIAVVGTGSGCGKTTVACFILRAIPGLGAVKIRRGTAVVIEKSSHFGFEPSMQMIRTFLVGSANE